MGQLSPNTIVHPTPTTTPRGGWWRWAVAVGLMILGVVVISYPLWPKVQFALGKQQPVFPYATRLVTNAGLTPAVTLTHLPEAVNKPAPKDNRLVIASIGVDMPIFDGPDEKTLDRGGIWHIPNTSDPTKGSNMVLSGHRWMYLPPSSRTLYLLDKVQIGEPIIVYWQGHEYDYRVDRRSIINPNQVEILNPTADPQLTIFTCTPLFSTKQRLVLFSTLIS